jgi:CheY-like chemotaxis protein
MFSVASQLLVTAATTHGKGGAMDAAAVRRIVIVDDDDFVRESMEMILEGVGHRIRSTASGHEALRWLEEEPCDLLIVDFKMPEIDGPDLYRQVLARWPVGGPRVLFVSGYAEVSGYERDPEVLAVPLLFKPFTLGDLFTAVDRALRSFEPCRVSIAPRPALN